MYSQFSGFNRANGKENKGSIWVLCSTHIIKYILFSVLVTLGFVCVEVERCCLAQEHPVQIVGSEVQTFCAGFV